MVNMRWGSNGWGSRCFISKTPAARATTRRPSATAKIARTPFIFSRRPWDSCHRILGTDGTFARRMVKRLDCRPNEIEHIAGESALFLNVSGSTLLRTSYMGCPCKILIDTDPGWNHFVNYPKWDANPGWQDSFGFRAHDYFFTYAERIGRQGCELPVLGISWQPTRPPVVLDCWQPPPAGRHVDDRHDLE